MDLIVQQGNPSAVIAAVFKAAEAFNQYRISALIAQVCYNAAHK